MPKINTAKEARRRLKAQRRAEKERVRSQRNQDKEASPIVEPAVIKDPSQKNYILCLKHGIKYSHDYVNRLYNMVKRNCTIDYEFVCLTDNPAGIHPDVRIIPLPTGIEGWWCKPYMYSADLPLNGTILYVDLDVVIASNIDKLFTYEPDHWCTVRDFTRAMRPKWNKYNSSVVRFKSGELREVWDRFKSNQRHIQRRLHGDQDWLFEATQQNKAMFFPDSWILSWKWEVRKSKEWMPGGMRGKRKFKHVEDVEPRVECCICVFHGDPNPHDCEDPWVVRNWQ